MDRDAAAYSRVDGTRREESSGIWTTRSAPLRPCIGIGADAVGCAHGHSRRSEPTGRTRRCVRQGNPRLPAPCSATATAPEMKANPQRPPTRDVVDMREDEMLAWRTNQMTDSLDDSRAGNPDGGDGTRAVRIAIGGLEIDRRKGAKRGRRCVSPQGPPSSAITVGPSRSAPDRGLAAPATSR